MLASNRNSSNIVFILFYYWLYIPLSFASISERSAGLRVWYLGPFSGWQLRLRSSVCYRTPNLHLWNKPQMSTTLHYTITVCCNRTAHRQHWLPVSVVSQEQTLKYALAIGELNPRPFASAAKGVNTRPPRPFICTLPRHNQIGFSWNMIGFTF